MICNKSGLKRKLKVSTVDIQIKQALFNLEIKKKRRSTIDLDIHHSKVFSSGLRVSHSKVPSSASIKLIQNIIKILRIKLL